MKPNLFRSVLSTLIYPVVLFFILWGNNLLINWGLKAFILPFFGWFYNLGFLFKLLFISIIGSTSLLLVFGLLMWLTAMIGMVLSYVFIYNRAVYIISIILVLINFTGSAIDMWAFIKFDFWGVIIWLMLLYFVFHMNWAFVFRDRKEIDREAELARI